MFFDHLSNIFLTIHDIKDEKAPLCCVILVGGQRGQGVQRPARFSRSCRASWGKGT